MAMNSISLKLFLAIFGLTSLVLLAGLGLARWSLNHSFNDYLNSIQEQRLDVIAEQLATHYTNGGNEWNLATIRVFDALVDPRAFETPRGGSLYSADTSGNNASQILLGQSLEDDLAQLAYLDQIIIPSQVNDFPSPMGMGPPGMGPGMGPVVQEVSNLRDYTVSSDALIEPILPRQDITETVQTSGGPPAGGPPPRRGPRVTPTVLFDANGNELATTGNFVANAGSVVKPIIIDDVIVGELRSIAIPEFDSPSENAFFAQQQLAGVAIILGSLFLSAIASWFLSRMMLAPIVKIKNGITELANGDYEQSLAVDRKDELGLLMTDVNKLSSKLQKNRLSRRNFIADISHELRTPVTILSGEIEAITDGVRDLSMSGVESLGHETMRLKHLIDDLYQLSLSDIGGLRYEFKTMDLNDLLTTVFAQYQNLIDTSGLNLQANLARGCLINGDNQRLIQLFTNLINNSIAYTDVPGIIRVNLNVDKDVVVQFEDSAPGVSDEQLTLMFEPLFRAEESRNRRAGGAGLGLAICRNIISAHDATIEASTSDLGGVSIKVKFPRVFSA